MEKRNSGFIAKLFISAILLIFLDYIGVFLKICELDYSQFFEYSLNKYVIELPMSENMSNTKFKYSFLHTPPKCSKQEAPRLTILVKSAIPNNLRRAVIRRTWGFENRFSDVKIRTVFILGETDNKLDMERIQEEANSNGDIVQTSFHDTYYNNTIKLLSGLHWASTFCSESQFYMFVDDDYYVSLKNVLRFIAFPFQYPDIYGSKLNLKINGEKSKNQSKLFAGYVFQTAPLRHKFSKWYVSLEEYPFNLWPPYVTAGAFILSNQALAELYSESLLTPIFRFDDIFLAILALKAQIKLTHCEQFHFQQLKYNGPESYRHALGSHGFDDSLYMERVWTECRSAGFA